jgi:hypothetical protein
MQQAEAKLQELLDRDSIRDCLLRYGRGIDREDEALLLSAFQADARVDHGSFIGRVADFPRRKSVTRGRWRVFQHYVTNHMIDLAGDEAHVESYFFAALRRPDGAIDLTGGRYIDRLERREGGWAVADRGVIVEWTGGLPSGGTATIPEGHFLSGAQDRTDPSYERPFAVRRAFRDLEP